MYNDFSLQKSSIKTSRKIISICLIIIIIASAAACKGNESFERIKPIEAGFSSEELKKVSALAEKTGTGAITVLYDGKLLYSWGNTSKNIPCHSIRKPFLGALYGIYISREDGKKIDINSTLKDLEIDDIPPVLSEIEKQAAIRDLLMSKSGIYHAAAAESEKMKSLRPERGSHFPGTFFYYNNWDFNVLGTIFEKTTGEKIFKSFKKNISDRIGMQDFNPDICSYFLDKDLSAHPAYNFKMSSRDMARFGLLYLNYGKWEETQIIPEKWIRESTESHSVKCLNGDDYGYLWSIIPESAVPGGGFYHTGYNNHFLGILPEQKLVVVYRSEDKPGIKYKAEDMRKILYMIYNAKKL